VGELKSKVRYILYKYLNNELADDEFKEQITRIIHEFEEKMPKKLLYQDIGLIVQERELPTMSDKFRRIWVILDDIEPKIKEALDYWKKSMSK